MAYMLFFYSSLSLSLSLSLSNVGGVVIFANHVAPLVLLRYSLISLFLLLNPGFGRWLMVALVLVVLWSVGLGSNYKRGRREFFLVPIVSKMTMLF